MSGTIDFGSSIPITRRATYTPTFDAGLTGSSSANFWWWRVGQHLYIDGKLTFTGAGGATEDITISLPNSYQFDTTVMPGGALNTNKDASMIGWGYWFQQGSGWLFVNANYMGSTSFFMTMNSQHLQANQLNNGDGVRIFVQAPILGW